MGTDEIDGWVSARHVEIWNHSASHRGVVTTEDLMDEVVASIGEIEEQLPSAQGKVWDSTRLESRERTTPASGRAPVRIEWTTEAGRIILAHHAVVSGHLSGTSQRLLDGQLRDGLAHVTMDARPVEDIIARIDSVARKKRGLQLMLHPSRLNMDGKLSIEGLTAVLDHLVDLRERREIATLSPINWCSPTHAGRQQSAENIHRRCRRRATVSSSFAMRAYAVSSRRGDGSLAQSGCGRAPRGTGRVYSSSSICAVTVAEVLCLDVPAACFAERGTTIGITQ